MAIDITTITDKSTVSTVSNYNSVTVVINKSSVTIINIDKNNKVTR